MGRSNRATMRIAFTLPLLCFLSNLMNSTCGKHYLVETNEKNQQEDLSPKPLGRSFGGGFCDMREGGYYHWKANIHKLENITTWQKCADQCGDQPEGCRFWSFGHYPNRHLGTCYLKYAAIGWISDNNWQSGNKACARAGGSCNMREGGYYHWMANIDKLEDITTWQKCADQCANHPQCKIWSFGHYPNQPLGTCYLKTAAFGWISDDNWQSGNEACAGLEEPPR